LDPVTGRFLSEDPVAGNVMSPMSMQGHTYANSNPTRYIDPDGREIRWDVSAEKKRPRTRAVESALHRTIAYLNLVEPFVGSSTLDLHGPQNDVVFDASGACRGAALACASRVSVTIRESLENQPDYIIAAVLAHEIGLHRRVQLAEHDSSHPPSDRTAFFGLPELSQSVDVALMPKGADDNHQHEFAAIALRHSIAEVVEEFDQIMGAPHRDGQILLEPSADDLTSLRGLAFRYQSGGIDALAFRQQSQALMRHREVRSFTADEFYEAVSWSGLLQTTAFEQHMKLNPRAAQLAVAILLNEEIQFNVGDSK
jgi:hypothetical protein